jgi:DNA primase
VPGRIPQSFIDDLLARVDIVDVVAPHVHLKQAGRDFKGLCPFHDEKTPSFTVSPDKQFYHCFGCGAHGSAIGFLMARTNMGFVEAIEELAGIAGLQVPHEGGASESESKHQALYDINAEAARFFAAQLRSHPAAPKAVEYLKRRGVSGEIARDFALGYAPPDRESLLGALGTDRERRERLFDAGLVIRGDRDRFYDRFRDRLMFPIHDQRGRIVGFGGRIIDAGEPKYLNSPETAVFRKGHELYGYQRARKPARDQQRIFLVEGYMDVIGLVQHGVEHVVASLGTATTREHLERLFRATPEVVFCFDGDRAGSEAAWRALQTALPLLSERRYVSFLFLPSGHDPDSFVRAEGRALFDDRSATLPLSEFLFKRLLEQVDLTHLDGRARLYDQAKPLIDKVPAGVYRELLENRLKELAGLSPGPTATVEVVSERTSKRGPARPPGSRGAPSLVRTAIGLLLRDPRVAAQAGSTEWVRHLELPGAGLLAELIELAVENPTLSGVAVVERYRETETGRHLAKLLAEALAAPAIGVEAEFQGAVARLRERAARNANPVPSNARPSELSAADKDALRQSFAELAKRI